MDRKDKERSNQAISILNQLFTAYLILFEPFMTVLKLMGIDRFYRDSWSMVTRLKIHRQPLDIFMAVLFGSVLIVLSVMIIISTTPICI